MMKKLIAFLLMMTMATSCSLSLNLFTSTVVTIEIHEVEQLGQVNPEVMLTIDDEDVIDVLLDAFNSSTKIAGDLDMDFPDYYFKFIYADGSFESFKLWIDERLGAIANVKDTATGYNLSAQAFETINQILVD